MKALYKRLRELELQTNGDPLIVRFTDQAGVDRVGSVDDLVKQDGYFVRVVSGSSLRDVDRILAMTKTRAAEYATRNNQKADQSGKSDEKNQLWDDYSGIQQRKNKIGVVG